MAYTVTLHTYRDADLIKAVEEASKQFSISNNKATKPIMRFGLDKWNQMSEEEKRSAIK